jgi:hypothetical protein
MDDLQFPVFPEPAGSSNLDPVFPIFPVTNIVRKEPTKKPKSEVTDVKNADIT